MVAGDPDVPGDSGMLGDDVMNYELPSIGKTVKCVSHSRAAFEVRL